MRGNLIMSPENMQAFERSIDMLDSSLREIRRVANDLMPEVLFRFGLDMALRDFFADIDKAGTLNVNYQSTGLNDVQIAHSTAIALFRAAEELMNNIIRHAAARNAVIRLSGTDRHITLTVEDDGMGFEPGTPNALPGTGLEHIRNRVEFLKGKIDIRSAPGKGSSVMIVVNN